MFDLNQIPDVLILRVRHVPFIDATGINGLKVVYRKLQSRGGEIIISGANEEVKEELFKSGVYEDLGEANICDNIQEALDRVALLMDEKTSIK